MIRKITLVLMVCMLGSTMLMAQTNTPGTTSGQKLNLRPISREYAPVRKSNNYDRVTRVKKPVIHPVVKKANQKAIRKKAIGRKEKSAAIRKARMEKGRMRRSM